MAPMSAAERKKYREQQKLKQGYAAGPSGTAGGSSAPPPPPEAVVVEQPSGPRVPSPHRSPPAKKLKTGPVYELGIQASGDPVTASAWKQKLKTQKRGSTPGSPVRTVFDARYPLNEFLSKAAGSGDVERVKSLGVKETLSAVKSYGHYISVLTHIAEGEVEEAIAEKARVEEELKAVRQDLAECKEERNRLAREKTEYLAEKDRLDAEVKRLTTAEKSLTALLEQAKKDWENAQLELGSCNEALGGVAAHFPDLPSDASLADAVSDLKGSVAVSFEDGFNSALAQLRVLHPGVDESQFDAYKVVKDGRIVDEDEAVGINEEVLEKVVDPLRDIAAVGEFLLNNEGLEGEENAEAAEGRVSDAGGNEE